MEILKDIKNRLSTLSNESTNIYDSFNLEMDKLEIYMANIENENSKLRMEISKLQGHMYESKKQPTGIPILIKQKDINQQPQSNVNQLADSIKICGFKHPQELAECLTVMDLNSTEDYDAVLTLMKKYEMLELDQIKMIHNHVSIMTNKNIDTIIYVIDSIKP